MRNVVLDDRSRRRFADDGIRLRCFEKRKKRRLVVRGEGEY